MEDQGLPGGGGGAKCKHRQISGALGQRGGWGSGEKEHGGVLERVSPYSPFQNHVLLCFSVADQLAYQVPPAHTCSPRTPARAFSPSRGSLEA